MNIYLAATFARFPEMLEKKGELEALGHIVTSRWMQSEHQLSYDDMLTLDAETVTREQCRFAQEDIEDILAADLLIQFTDGQASSTRGGRHVEFGFMLGIQYALAHFVEPLPFGFSSLILIVGPRENVFHSLPPTQVTHVETWDAGLTWLAEVCRMSGRRVK